MKERKRGTNQVLLEGDLQRYWVSELSDKKKKRNVTRRGQEELELTYTLIFPKRRRWTEVLSRLYSKETYWGIEWDFQEEEEEEERELMYNLCFTTGRQTAVLGSFSLKKKMKKKVWGTKQALQGGDLLRYWVRFPRRRRRRRRTEVLSRLT